MKRLWLALGLLVAIPAVGLARPAPKSPAVRHAAVPEPMTGMRLFQERCAACHEEWQGGQNKTGPALFGVVGRPVGSAPGFDYSAVFREARARGDVWSVARLDAYLDEPMAMYSHTGMQVLFVNPDDQAALIAYLKSRTPAG